MLPEPAHPLELRMAKLEGSYEQVDKRLSSIETRLDSGFSELRFEISALRREQDAKFDGLEKRLEAKINSRFSLLAGLSTLLVIFEVLRSFGVIR